MILCSVCRGLQPADCPACDNDNEPSIPEQDIVAEIFRDPGEPYDPYWASEFSIE